MARALPLAGAAHAPALAIAISAVLWGAWWIPLRALEERGLSGSWATVGVYAVAFALLVPIIARARLIAHVRWLGAIALLSGVSLALWNHALIVGDVVRSMLLFFLCPVWATLITRFVLGQPLSQLRVVSVPLGLIGAAIVLGIDNDIPIPRGEGDVLATLSGFLFAIGTIVIRQARAVADWDKTAATFLGCAAGASLVAVLAPSGTAPAASTVVDALPMLLACAGLVILPSTWLEVWGNSRLDPGAVNVIFQIEIVVAALTAGVLTDEPFGAREIVGGVLIVCAGLIETFDHGRRGAGSPARTP
jgi:drug/metabolite transporter (DMT)-like permease